MNVPEELKHVVKQYTYGRAQAYASDKAYFQSFYDFVSLVIELAFVVSGALPYFWDKTLYFTQLFNSQSEVLPLINL